MQPVVTVGLDGSPESLAAARWAADEAEKRKLTLRLLHAWPLLAPEPTGDSPGGRPELLGEASRPHRASELQTRHPGLLVVGSLVPDDAQNALIQAASESEMTVLGSRGLESVESYFLGDISLPVVARAQRPVILVRADAQERVGEEAPPEATAAAWSWP